MSSDDEEILRQEAQKIETKFDFYILALTFTILGFSVETARLGRTVTGDLLEFMAWATLLGSGLAGLSRLSRTPQLFHFYAGRAGLLDWIAEIAKGAADSRIYSAELDDSIPAPLAAKLAKTSLEKNAPELARLEKRLEFRRRLQFRAFAVGVLALVLARSLPRIVDLRGYVLR